MYIVNLIISQEEDDHITTPHHPTEMGSFEVPQSENGTACPDFADTTGNMHQHQRLLNQIKMLERQAEVSELELQSLRKQIVQGSRKVEELSRDIFGLEKERDFLKAQCEGQKPSPESTVEPEAANNSHSETAKLSPTSEAIRQELQWEKNLNRKLRSQLQKTEDSNSELILAVRDLKGMLNKKDREISHLSSKKKFNQDDPEALLETMIHKINQNEEKKELEKLVKEDRRDDEVEVLKQKIKNLHNEVELSRKEKEEMNMCWQQLSKDYEILKKEKTDIYADLQKEQMLMMEMKHEYEVSLATVKQLKLQQEKLEQEIKKQTLLSSKYLVAINELETQVQSLEEELEKQALDFEYNLKGLNQVKDEQEQRARQAEETLEKVNRKNNSLVEHLKAEFTRTSKEMGLKIDEKEKIAMKAVGEANDLLLQNEHLEKLLKETEDELELTKDVYEKLQHLSHKIYPEAQHSEQLTLHDNENAKLETTEVYDNYEAQATENQMIKGERREQIERSVCKEDVNQKAQYDKEQKEMPHGESEIQQRWSEDNQALKGQLISARKEAKKLLEDNISLRTLIDEMKRKDEHLHLDIEKLSLHHNEQRHCSPGLNLENGNLKSQLFKQVTIASGTAKKIKTQKHNIDNWIFMLIILH